MDRVDDLDERVSKIALLTLASVSKAGVTNGAHINQAVLRHAVQET